MTGRVKGWCPGALRPMPSGDGLVARVRPPLGRLTRDQALGLCDLAERYAGGRLELTNRANVQLRGVAEADHPAILDRLAVLALIDPDAATERRRNILIQPFEAREETDAIARNLMKILPQLPDIPAKFGFAVDVGARRFLSDASADLRVERGQTGGLILRADGAARGVPVGPEDMGGKIAGICQWFNGVRGARRRMREVAEAIPDDWQAEAPTCAIAPPQPGLAPGSGRVLGVPFGDLEAAGLRRLFLDVSLQEISITHYRTIFLPGHVSVDKAGADGFVSDPDNPMMSVSACAGAPFCESATVATRALARRLAGRVTGTLHVSGCAKGCAHPKAADMTLVGRDGGFDLVQGGAPWDEPVRRGLDPAALMDGTETL